MADATQRGSAAQTDADVFARNLQRGGGFFRSCALLLRTRSIDRFV